jgi:hypothetical protein
MTQPWSNQAVSLVVIQATPTAFTGLFEYSPTVGTNDLIIAEAPAAGTDPYGNPYPKGITSQTGSGSLRATLNDGSLTMAKLSGVLAPPLISMSDGTSATTDGTSIRSSGMITPITSAVLPGDTTGAIETWHSLGTLSGYSVTTGVYRMAAEGELEVAVDVTGSGAHALSVTFSVTLPALYRPGNAPPQQPLTTNRNQAAGDGFPRLQVTTGGAVTVTAPAINTTTAYRGTMRFPLDL